MTSKLTAILCTFFLIHFSNQVSAQKGFEMGAFVMPQSPWILNSTDFDKGPELDYKFNSGIAYGVQASMGFTYQVGLRVELAMSGQGQKYTTASNYVVPNYESQVKLNYINVPVLFRYTGSLARAKSAFQLLVGPQFGMLREAKVETKDFKTTLDSTYNSTDISAVVGLGLTAEMAKNLFFQASFRMAYSLQNIEKREQPNRDPSHNAVVGLQLGVAYVFGKQ